MMTTRCWSRALGLVCSSVVAVGIAAPVTYVIDPSHTFPAFEADHWAGLSIWRGKVNETAGTVVLDKEAETGTIEVTMQMDSIDFGHDGMNEVALVDVLHVAEFPTATYTGRLVDFTDGAPTAAEGTLTLHGVSRPVNLEITRFRCQPHFRLKSEVCGADATTTIDRGEYGIDYDLENGFFPEVLLLITVEGRVPE